MKTVKRIETHIVRHSESGPDGRLKLGALFDFLQNAAACHAEDLGVGMGSLYASRMLWVLSRIKVEISRYPAIGEYFTLLTYPSGVERLFALRQFTLTDAQDQVFARASSCWLILDAETLKPYKAADIIREIMPPDLETHCHFPGLDKLSRPPEQTEQCEFRVRHSEIDVNRHLNNAVYAAYVTDTVSVMLGEFARIGEVQINFLHPGLPGDRIRCSGALQDGAFRISGDAPEGGECFFQAEGRLSSEASERIS